MSSSCSTRKITSATVSTCCSSRSFKYDWSSSSKRIINQSINQYIYNAPWYRSACYSADYADAKRNVLSRVLNVSTDGAVRQFRGREFQRLGAATEKRRIIDHRSLYGRFSLRTKTRKFTDPDDTRGWSCSWTICRILARLWVGPGYLTLKCRGGICRNFKAAFIYLVDLDRFFRATTKKRSSTF